MPTSVSTTLLRRKVALIFSVIASTLMLSTPAFAVEACVTGTLIFPPTVPKFVPTAAAVLVVVTALPSTSSPDATTTQLPF